MKPTIAIDPGASGGMAWTDRDGIKHAEPMPATMTEQEIGRASCRERV